MSAVDLSGTIALGAIGLLTLNLLLGLLLSVGYNPTRQWPRLPVKLFTFHNWTGYAAFAAVVIHAGALLFSGNPHFRLIDVLVPIHSPVSQCRTVSARSAISSRSSSGSLKTACARRWGGTGGSVSHTTYGAATVFFFHGVIADRSSRGGRSIDAEKVAVELCAVAVIAALRVASGTAACTAGSTA